METRTRTKMELTSSAFKEGGPIPKLYTCDGRDYSPPLAWQGAPDDIKSFALIVDDPDAPSGTFVHWVLFNLPGDANQLPEKVPTLPTLANGAKQGANSFGKIGYNGPCPPSGTHRYFFKLYGLDAELDLQPGAKKADMVQAMDGHIVAEGQLMGRYSRQ